MLYVSKKTTILREERISVCCLITAQCAVFIPLHTHTLELSTTEHLYNEALAFESVSLISHKILQLVWVSKWQLSRKESIFF